MHTLLGDLPTGLFYAQGVKANVGTFLRKRARAETPWTKQLWIYDLRTNKHFTLAKHSPLTRADALNEFVGPVPGRATATSARATTGRPRTRMAVGAPTATMSWYSRDKTSYDIFWLKDDSLADSD